MCGARAASRTLIGAGAALLLRFPGCAAEAAAISSAAPEYSRDLQATNSTQELSSSPLAGQANAEEFQKPQARIKPEAKLVQKKVVMEMQTVA